MILKCLRTSKGLANPKLLSCHMQRFLFQKFQIYRSQGKNSTVNISVLLLFIYLFRRREGERERNISLWLPLVHPLLGTWPATQAFALTGNQTGDLLVHRPALSPLSHTSQGYFIFFERFIFLFALREKGREGEREGEKQPCVRDVLISCLLCAPCWGPGLQPRHVP